VFNNPEWAFERARGVYVFDLGRVSLSGTVE
jgi:hypothetical protein